MVIFHSKCWWRHAAEPLSQFHCQQRARGLAKPGGQGRGVPTAELHPKAHGNTMSQTPPPREGGCGFFALLDIGILCLWLHPSLIPPFALCHHCLCTVVLYRMVVHSFQNELPSSEQVPYLMALGSSLQKGLQATA